MVLAKCKCKSEFQDEHYGIGMRAHNIVNKQSTSVQKLGRCTVCGEERYVNIEGNIQQQVATEDGKGKKEKTSKHDKQGKHSGREGREKKSKTKSL
ncbi:MAG: hypothetical protein E4G89_01700 [Methanothrix sp.]|nr:MAG: hypothetical protein E4G89_01700 [Methanothrix sp.]